MYVHAQKKHTAMCFKLSTVLVQVIYHTKWHTYAVTFPEIKLLTTSLGTPNEHVCCATANETLTTWCCVEMNTGSQQHTGVQTEHQVKVGLVGFDNYMAGKIWIFREKQLPSLKPEKKLLQLHRRSQTATEDLVWKGPWYFSFFFCFKSDVQ